MAAVGMVLAAAVLLLATWVYGKVGGTIPLVLEALPRVARGHGSGHGYVDPRRKLGRGHILAAAAFGVAVFLYVLGYVFLRPDRALVPSLGYILLLLLVAGWGLPGLSFFLDRYRVPVVFLLLAASFLSSQIFDTDHYYRIERQTAPPPPLPGQAFNAAEQRLGEGGPADRGGRGERRRHHRVALDRPRAHRPAGGGGDRLHAVDPPDQLGLGGSVGTMYFLDRYTSAGSHRRRTSAPSSTRPGPPACTPRRGGWSIPTSGAASSASCCATRPLTAGGRWSRRGSASSPRRTGCCRNGGSGCGRGGCRRRCSTRRWWRPASSFC